MWCWPIGIYSHHKSLVLELGSSGHGTHWDLHWDLDLAWLDKKEYLNRIPLDRAFTLLLSQLSIKDHQAESTHIQPVKRDRTVHY